MNMEMISERAWTAVLTGAREVQFEFFGLQLLLVNLRNRLQSNELTIQACIQELGSFETKFRGLPVADKDFNKIREPSIQPVNLLLAPEEAAARIAAGQTLLLASEEHLLASLPAGNWIGGTIPYFRTSEGGCFCKDKIFVTEIPAEFPAFTRQYTASELSGLNQNAAVEDVSFVILPADSAVHTEFALHAPHYPGFALHPLVGWIAGVDLEMLGKASPKVFCGGPAPLVDAAAVMRIKLPADHRAQISIINLFKPGGGEKIRFPSTGFSTALAEIGGRQRNFAEYLKSIDADTRLPLVANYCGAMVNVSLKRVDWQNGLVEFYAPVVAGIEYQLAAPVEEYGAEFESRLAALAPKHVMFSCDCVLNYLYSKQRGGRSDVLVGPVTFGEIACQLLNQTLVYLEIVNVHSPEFHRTGGSNDGTDFATLRLSATQEELEASEQRFRALSESAPIGIFLTDNAGRIVYENRCCRELSGNSNGTEGAWTQHIHPQDLPRLYAAYEASERNGSNLSQEFRFVATDGSVRWVHAQSVVLRTESGKVTGRIGTLQDITERKESESRLERLNQDLIHASREAGMAELANGVLHNVKNIINSINVSAGVISEQVKQSTASNLTRVTELLREHASDLGTFLSEHPKGKLVPRYLEQLADQLAAEHTAILSELQQFEKNVEHIKDIVTMQQEAAKRGGASVQIRPAELMEDSVRIVAAGLARHGILVVREYEPDLPEITVEKHKVLQILVNFVRNAKHACQASGQPNKKVTLRASQTDGFVHFTVGDNGVGMSPETRSRLFQHGFTTKKEGHGFGLHSGAQAARDLGGEIQVHSDGIGTGATFTLRLPGKSPANH